jgi:hypothetical protein
MVESNPDAEMTAGLVSLPKISTALLLWSRRHEERRDGKGSRYVRMSWRGHVLHYISSYLPLRNFKASLGPLRNLPLLSSACHGTNVS